MYLKKEEGGPYTPFRPITYQYQQIAKPPPKQLPPTLFPSVTLFSFVFVDAVRYFCSVHSRGRYLCRLIKSTLTLTRPFTRFHTSCYPACVIFKRLRLTSSSGRGRSKHAAIHRNPETLHITVCGLYAGQRCRCCESGCPSSRASCRM